MMPGANDLCYFLEVASGLNLSRAAERLGITQPTLSQSVKRLENCVGTQLFYRSKKGVYLTPAGHEVYKNAKRLIHTWDQVKISALAQENSIQGRLTLGVHQSVAIYTLPHFLPNVLEKHPRLEIILQHDLSRKITEEVIGLKVDLGLVINPVRHPDLIITPLATDEVSLWSHNQKCANNDLSSGKAVLISDFNLLQSQSILKKMKNLGLNFSRTLHSSSLEVITTLVEAKAGIGLLPGRVAKSFNFPNLNILPNTPSFQDELALVYRVEHKKIASLIYLGQEIKKIYSKGPTQ